MIDNLWKCFETTGKVDHYLGFKDYEKLKAGLGENDLLNTAEPSIIDEANER